MKRAIVTGGTKGIGKAIAEILLRLDYYVYITYGSDDLKANEAEQYFRKISHDNFCIVKLNQRNPDEIHKIKDLIYTQNIDCIVCNAGTTLRKNILEITNEEWLNVFNVGLNFHFFLIRDLWKNIQPNSRIIFIGSMMAIYPHSTSIAYGTMKSAVHGFAINLVKEFGQTGTTVNVIAPGFVDTEWQKNKPQEIRNNIYNKTAAGRFAKPEEIADVVKMILNNGFVNGAVIQVSGGYCYK